MCELKQDHLDQAERKYMAVAIFVSLAKNTSTTFFRKQHDTEDLKTRKASNVLSNGQIILYREDFNRDFHSGCFEHFDQIVIYVLFVVPQEAF